MYPAPPVISSFTEFKAFWAVYIGYGIGVDSMPNMVNFKYRAILNNKGKEMKLNTIYIVLASVALLGAMLFASVSATDAQANVTNATLSIELAKTSFAVNETIQGTITIPLSKAMDANGLITVKAQLPMKRVEKSLKIGAAFDNASIAYTKTAPESEASNPTASKTLTFSDGGSQSVAVKVPAQSLVESFDMGISAPGGNDLEEVKLDVGGEGNIDWYYLGDREGWASEFTIPQGLGATAEGTSSLRNNLTRICQIIELPNARDFQVHANYRRLGTAGNITAALISMEDQDPPMPSGTILSCDLPESSDFGWYSCEINAEFGLNGEYLVCIYSTNGTGTDNLYEINTESGETSTGFSCPVVDADECTSLGTGNPFIKIKQAEYSKKLRGAIDFSAWSTGIEYIEDLGAVGSTLAELNVIANPVSTVCPGAECIVELKFIANNSGEFTLSDVVIQSSIAGVGKTSRVFYDLESASELIASVGGVPIPANATIEIPLSIFNLTAPKPALSSTNQGYIEVTFNGKEANASFSVGGVALSPSTAAGMAAETRTALNALSSATGDTRLALKILGKDGDITAALSELGNISTDSDTQAARDRIKALRDNLPKEVMFGSSIRDFQLIEPGDITPDIAPESEKESVYFMQEKAQVKVSASSFTIKNFAGATARYALIKKEITAKSPMAKVDIYEVIDKSVADASSDIMFEQAPDSVVKADPIVKWFQPELSTGAKIEKNYVVRSEFDVGIDKVKTIIVPSSEEGIPACEGEDCGAEEASCGDKICTSILEDSVTCPEDCTSKTPWGTIIAIIIVALLLFVYVGFYRGKYSLWHMLKRKKPFAAPAELESVKDFIRSSREKKMDDSVIKTKLLEKGWKDSQVKFAFGEMDWEKKVKAAEKPAQDTSPVKEYIQTALSRGLSKEKILTNLTEKGWDREIVERELKLK